MQVDAHKEDDQDTEEINEEIEEVEEIIEEIEILIEEHEEEEEHEQEEDKMEKVKIQNGILKIDEESYNNEQDIECDSNYKNKGSEENIAKKIELEVNMYAEEEKEDSMGENVDD